MTGITSGAMFAFRFQPVSIFLVMALGTIHCSGSFRGLVILVYHTAVTIIATHLLTAMDGGLIFLQGHIEAALRTPFLMASDTILRRVT